MYNQRTFCKMEISENNGLLPSVYTLVYIVAQDLKVMIQPGELISHTSFLIRHQFFHGIVAATGLA